MATKEELQSLRSRVEQLSEEHVYSPATSFANLLAVLDGILSHLIHERDMPAGLTHRVGTEAPVEGYGLQINLPDDYRDDPNVFEPDPDLSGAR